MNSLDCDTVAYSLWILSKVFKFTGLHFLRMRHCTVILVKVPVDAINGKPNHQQFVCVETVSLEALNLH